MGYYRAGYRILGIDIAPQPNYPFDFIQDDVRWYCDAFTALDLGASAIHASPPCQRHSTQRTGMTKNYEDLLDETRELVKTMSVFAGGIPYVIENVPGAPLIDPVRLCGTSLGCIDGDADLQRHRLFESNVKLTAPPCNHSRDRRTLGVYGDMGIEDRPNRPITAKNPSPRGWKAGAERARRLMGIDWTVTNRELAEAIPPAYTELIGAQLICL